MRIFLATVVFAMSADVLGAYRLHKQATGEIKDVRNRLMLAQNGIFASRDPEWVKENPDTQAINVVTYIDQFDKRAEGFRGHYDRLSERCHPNSLERSTGWAVTTNPAGRGRFNIGR
jgi:hypothetical protein